MKEEKFLIPRKGLIVRDPETKDIMPESGMLVPWYGRKGTYYRRRVQCNDCKIIENDIKLSKKKIVSKDKTEEK